MPRTHTTADAVPYITRIPMRPGQREVDQDVDLRPTRDLGQGSHVHRQDPNFVAGHADSSYAGYGAYATLDGSRVDTSEFADPDWAGARIEPERPATPAAPRDFSGRGPRDYRRTDARILDEVCEALTRDDRVDASEIAVSVVHGEVLLTGTVADRDLKHLAEDIAYRASGVLDVTNQLRVGPLGQRPAPDSIHDREDADEPTSERLHTSIVDRGEDDDDLLEWTYQGPRDTARNERIGEV